MEPKLCSLENSAFNVILISPKIRKGRQQWVKVGEIICLSLADKQIISDLIKGCNYSRSFVEGKDVTGVLHRRQQRWHFKKCSAFFPQTPFLNF